MFWKEFPEIKINYDYVEQLTAKIIEQDAWSNIRKLKRVDNFNFDFSAEDAKFDTDKSKRREYLQKVIFAYKLSDEEMKNAETHCEAAYLFKTLINTPVYIHKESRAVALNFPIVFEPEKSYVAFYDEEFKELDRHTLVSRIPMCFDVVNWHTVRNESMTSPRIVLTCSWLKDEWSNLIA